MRHLPKAVLFDFGNTLFLESAFNADAGNKYLLENNNNPYNISFDQIKNKVEHFKPYIQKSRETSLLEHSWTAFTKLVYEPFGMNVTDQINEIGFWEAALKCSLAPGIVDFLNTLKSMNIKSGIVSNNAFNAKTLEYELNKNGLLEYFEFVISSADYGIRKPHPFLFEVAIQKTGCECKDIWFIGDSIDNDFYGSKKVGMVPFLYSNSNSEKYIEENNISSWYVIDKLIKEIGSNVLA